MLCPKCGSQIDDGSAYCSSCGSQIEGEAIVPAFADAAAPVNASRSVLTWILLSIITCGIYGWYFIYSLAQDMNRMCRGDGEETPGLFAFVALSIVTCGIYSYWWYYKIGNRMQRNAPRYGLMFQENGTTILLWMSVGALLCGIGPFIAMYIIVKNSNALGAAYNARLACE